MLLKLTSFFSGLEIAKICLEFGVFQLFFLDVEHFELKNAAFDLDVAFHMCQIEFVSAGNSDGQNNV